jgi:predicted GTPase
MTPPVHTIILGAAGRDFHDFNVVFRDDPTHRVVAFTATQIPGIENRRYPAELAGPLYPDGIPIVSEADLEPLIRDQGVERVVHSYSDVSHEEVMHLASRAMAAGAGFSLLPPSRTMLRSKKPVVAVCAVRTGCGKGALTRHVAGVLRRHGRRVAIVRHPMPYGDLVAQRVQRFATAGDLEAAAVTLEEREEYEPHLESGHVVFAGVDYGEILLRAEREGDVILWDGGNNDLPFFRPSVHFCLVDPHRPGHERRFHPGEANLRMAGVAVVTKEDTALAEDVREVVRGITEVNPQARIVHTRMPITVEGAELRGRRVLCVEDGPTVTHGGLRAGAAEIAARRAGATLVDPRPYLSGGLAALPAAYPALGPVLPALGYGAEQRADLQATIRAVPCDVVLLGTPIDLARTVAIGQPVARARYGLEEVVPGEIEAALEGILGSAFGP